MNQSAKSSVKTFVLSSLILTSAFVACDKDDDEPKDKIEFTVSATADGAQEVPAVTSDGSGTLTGTYNKNTNVLNYTVSWEQLSGPVTDMHFHGPAAVGEPAGVAVPITGFTETPNGSFTGTATLSDVHETDMLGGKWYVNLHTDLHKAGEIRGQVKAE